MSNKYLIKIGYTQIVFDNPETAMRTYAMLTESTPVETCYIYGADSKKPDQYESVEYVRAADVEIELKRVDSTKFALQFTEDEFRAKCKIQPTEVDGDARLVEAEVLVAKITGPEDADTSTDETQPEPFI